MHKRADPFTRLPIDREVLPERLAERASRLGVARPGLVLEHRADSDSVGQISPHRSPFYRFNLGQARQYSNALR